MKINSILLFALIFTLVAFVFTVTATETLQQEGAAALSTYIVSSKPKVVDNYKKKKGVDL